MDKVELFKTLSNNLNSLYEGIVSIKEFLNKSSAIKEREDIDPKSGKKKYGDVKFADEKNNKYPIDTEEHIRAAWNYIHQERNAEKYSDEDLKTIKNRIIKAWKDKIDKDGPPKSSEGHLEESMTEAELKVKAEDEAKAAEEKIKAEAELKEKELAEAKAKEEAENKAKAEAEEKTKIEEAKARAEEVKKELEAQAAKEAEEKEKAVATANENAKKLVEQALAEITGVSGNSGISVSEWSYKNDKGQTVLVKTVTETSEQRTTSEEVVANATATAKANEDIMTEEMKKMMKKKMNHDKASEWLDETELDETEKALASQYTVVDLIKLATQLSKEVAGFRAEKAEVELKVVTENRINELVNLGIAFEGAKASIQRDKVGKMDEVAFASYKEELIVAKESFSKEEDPIEKARKAAGNKSTSVDLSNKNNLDKYSLLN